ncbi:bacterioferritin [Pullulanibacillus pueri]|uniref:Bacterioferritin n=1 Tax=Pullulanibacillus pueri TaxID=1437324 RepID=A0A8J2ZYU9_9BACL|nr:ferritin-like domain-containing protein [Pullulanibacillus pueri]MBM7683434.1 bacterioferritin [Pullulanibacillus pueri]GGH87388.1 bacterioferritin [Pullulanibacillus pueri]
MDEKMKALIDGLNEDLANEYGAVIQYTTYAATVSGMHYQVLKPFFEDEIPDEQGHASYLSEKIATLGGNPTTKPAEVVYTTDAKRMLEEVHKSESDTIERYKKRRKQADELGLIDLVVKLEDMIADETKHKEITERMLNDHRLS